MIDLDLFSISPTIFIGELTQYINFWNEPIKPNETYENKLLKQVLETLKTSLSHCSVHNFVSGFSSLQ